ncbi:MAG: hypothetical protein NTZ90_08765 [Proteobacteria bacterium]|nr:hypothetical protein [Pseudomonadota bacterium]
MGEAQKKIVTVGKNGQISIGKEYAGRTLEIAFFEDGRAMLSPGRFVPDHQAIFFTPDAEDKLARFAVWEKDHPPEGTSSGNLRAEKLATPRKKPKAGGH